jgi:hypothetical protein
MLTLLKKNSEKDLQLSPQECNGWAYIIHQIRSKQLLGLKKELPSRPKTFADISEWVLQNQAPSQQSTKVRLFGQYAGPITLYVLGGLWLNTIFEWAVLTVYALPALGVLGYLLYKYSLREKQRRRLMDTEHFESIQQQLLEIQQTSQDTSDNKAYFISSEGVLFSYMQNKNETSTHHVLSIRSTTEHLFTSNIILLTLIALERFPPTHGPIVFQTKADVYHILYTHTGEEAYIPPKVNADLSLDNLNANSWLVQFHHQSSTAEPNETFKSMSSTTDK